MDSQFTIVIADDHPLFRGALYQAVHMAINDAQLLEADSIDSLTSLLGEHPEVDLLLLDLKMPGANGFEGLAYLAASTRTCPSSWSLPRKMPPSSSRCCASGPWASFPNRFP